MKKNTGLALWVMAGGTLLAVIMRIYQIVVCTDMNTGFLFHENNFFENYGFYIIAVLAAAGAAAGAVIDGRRELGGFSVGGVVDGRAAVLGFAMLIMGLCAAYEGYTELSAISPSGFLIFVDFAFGAAMLVIAFVTLYKKEFSPGLGFSYCAAALYFTLRGVNVFLDRMVINTVPEYLIECLSVIGGAVFFMLFAKLMSGNEHKNTRTALCAWGVPTVVITLGSALATIISGFIAPAEVSERITSSRYAAEMYYQVNGGRNAYMMVYTPWVNVAMALFIAAALIMLFLRKKEEADAENAPAELSDENAPSEEIPADEADTAQPTSDDVSDNEAADDADGGEAPVEETEGGEE